MKKTIVEKTSNESDKFYDIDRFLEKIDSLIQTLDLNEDTKLTDEQINDLMACVSEGELDQTETEVGELFLTKPSKLISWTGSKIPTNKNYNKISDLDIILKYIGNGQYIEYFTQRIITLYDENDNFNNHISETDAVLAISKDDLTSFKAFNNKDKERLILKITECKEIKNFCEWYEKACLDVLDFYINYYKRLAYAEDKIKSFQNDDIKPSGR